MTKPSFPREILHNCTEKRPGQTPHAVDYEEIRNYLLDKKLTQKRYHNQNHNVKSLPELKPGQKILFLSPNDENQYIQGTVTSKASTSRSYYLESQGKQYHCTRQHIHPIDINALQDHQQTVLQDHQRDKQLVSQNHQSTKQPGLQDHQHTTKMILCKTINQGTNIGKYHPAEVPPQHKYSHQL